MEKIRNIIVSTHDSLYPIKGGGALRTLKAAEEFKKRGFNVIIIAPTEAVGELNGIKVHWLHSPRKQRSQILSSIKFNVRLLRKFMQFIKKTNMFFIHNTISAASLPFLKPFFRFRYVLDITDIHAEYLHIGKRNIIEVILTPVLLFIEYSIIKAADKIIVVTNAMKAHLEKKGVPSNKIDVVYDGAEIDKIPKEKEPGIEKNIIHLGIVDRQHGVEHLLNAMPKVIARHREAKLFVVGGGRELENEKNRAGKLGISANCLFTDTLPCEKARQFLTKASIGVIPREYNLPNNIITTLKLYEYWASKTAVVSSRLSGIEEISKDKENILFFSPGSSDDLAQKLIYLLDNPGFTNKLVNNGYESAKAFAWDKLIPKLVDYSLK